MSSRTSNGTFSICTVAPRGLRGNTGFYCISDTGVRFWAPHRLCRLIDRVFYDEGLSLVWTKNRQLALLETAPKEIIVRDGGLDKEQIVCWLCRFADRLKNRTTDHCYETFV